MSKTKLPPIASKSRSKGSIVSAKRKSAESVKSKSSKLGSKTSNLPNVTEKDFQNQESVSTSSGISTKAELTDSFFNFMLDSIIEGRTLDAMSSSISILVQHRTLETRISYKEITEEDLFRSVIVGAFESDVIMRAKQSQSREKSSFIDIPMDERDRGSKVNRELLDASNSRQLPSSFTFSTSTQGSTIVDKLIPSYEVIYFKNGNEYSGLVQNNIMHGKGIYTWRDGTIYEGNFVDGFPTGQGKMILPDLATYEGNFYKGEFQGYGTLNIINTSMIYSGHWEDGKKHGSGWLLYGPKNWYNGEWFEHLRQGYGFRHYNNNARYKGNWSQGVRSGKGTVLYSNNDFYKGNWENDTLNGYGEYTWNTFLNKTLAYPQTSWFKGTWVGGMRHGAGVMNFGSETGARLAGIWYQNMKHGPGVMICGNGNTIQRAPLFQNNKAIHYSDYNEQLNPTPDEVTARNVVNIDQVQSFHDVIAGNSYPDIIKEINKKVAMDNINPEIVEELSRDNKFRPPSLNTIEKNCTPLVTPIHASPEDVNLEYYIDNVLSSCYKFPDYPADNNENTNNTEVSKIDLAYLQRRSLAVIKTVEQIQAKNTISLHLASLKSLYNRYATIATEKTVDFAPVMIRLFLWQLYRDMDITSRGVSLIEVDLELSKNPTSFMETDHDPFEPIYFWQFLQALVGTACLLYQKGAMEVKLSGSLVACIFKHFLTKEVLPKLVATNGTALEQYKNLLPIRNVYHLYLSLGEAHTARKFLSSTCTKKGFDPPCYLTVLDDSNDRRTFLNGENVIPFDQQVEFVQRDLEMGQRPENQESIIPEDPFRHTLYTLRFLGPRRVLKCLSTICPAIMKNGVVVNIDYQLCFLEFYEVLLLCGLTFITKEVKKRERRARIEALIKEREENPVVENAPKAKSDKDGKKKKGGNK